MTKKEILDYFSDINVAYNNAMSHDNLSSMLDELIGEDRQEIVRCKDCKYFHSEVKSEFTTCIGCNAMHDTWGKNWFCADGERADMEWQQQKRGQ